MFIPEKQLVKVRNSDSFGKLQLAG